MISNKFELFLSPKLLKLELIRYLAPRALAESSLNPGGATAAELGIREDLERALPQECAWNAPSVPIRASNIS